MKNNRVGKLLGGGIDRHNFLFEQIISPENIFGAWREFQKGKMKKTDVLIFAEKAEENLFELISDLKNERYAHGQYSKFCVYDPKLRKIAKAPVRDRILHHAIHRVLAPIFVRSFIFDSYSSRKEKGTCKAVERLQKFALKLSRNRTKTVWILQADIRKFFDSVDHEILLDILQRKIKSWRLMKLLEIIIKSFEFSHDKGIPLGNLTSQLFSNIYLDQLDQFIKREIGVKFYLRYADDFAILSCDKNFLEKCFSEISNFLENKLELELHSGKISLKKFHQGIDFLGYVIFPTHIILRTKTKRRMLKKMEIKRKELEEGKINDKSFDQALQSYLGILKHCRGSGIEKELLETNAKLC